SRTRRRSASTACSAPSRCSGTSKVLQAALAHHQAGRLREAEALYRELLAAEPGNSDALHLLGVAAHQLGRHDEAIVLIEKAIAADASRPEFHNNLGEALRALGRAPDAEK